MPKMPKPTARKFDSNDVRDFLNKKNNKILALVILTVFFILILHNRRDNKMAIDFTKVTGQNIDFGTISSTQLLSQKTVLAWIYFDTFPGAADLGGQKPSVSGTDEFYAFNIRGDNKIALFTDWTTTNGNWHTTAAISTGLRHVAFSYDYTSTSNDPVIYIDGVSVAITEVTNPAGSYISGTNSSHTIGAVNFDSFDGKMLSYSVYNRILSASEVADAYNSRLVVPNYNGLVFALNLNGAAGLQTFDGVTLGSTNYIKDIVSGATGTPNGSPVGVADAYLNWK